jgi:hypothetical protein
VGHSNSDSDARRESRRFALATKARERLYEGDDRLLRDILDVRAPAAKHNSNHRLHARLNKSDEVPGSTRVAKRRHMSQAYGFAIDLRRRPYFA